MNVALGDLPVGASFLYRRLDSKDVRRRRKMVAGRLRGELLPLCGIKPAALDSLPQIGGRAGQFIDCQGQGTEGRKEGDNRFFHNVAFLKTAAKIEHLNETYFRRIKTLY